MRAARRCRTASACQERCCTWSCTNSKTMCRITTGKKRLAASRTWLEKFPASKTSRNQIKDFSGVYAIEFTSAEAAADYAESPVHEAWSKTWQEQRENSLSFQVSNP